MQTTTVPHVRQPSTGTSAQRRAAYGSHGTNYNRRTQPTPTTYCGAEATTVDWDRRTALATSNVASVTEQGVCPACLVGARAIGTAR